MDMTYRELIELYKNEKLEEKQREIVKNDIERHEAISEYLFDEGEIPRVEDLERDNELSDSSITDKQDEEARSFKKMMKASIRKAFIKMGVIVGAVVLAIVMFVIYAVPQMMDSFYYDPAEVVSEKGDSETNRFTLDFATYSELFLPENYRDSVIVDRNGYGKYNINILQTTSGTGVFTNVAGRIEQGKLTLYDANLLSRHVANAFIPNDPDFVKNIGDSGSYYSDPMKELQKLNENDNYIAYVTLDEIKTISQFVNWCTKTEVSPDWCAIDLNNYEGNNIYRGTFGFNYGASCSEIKYDKNAYPYLSSFDADTTSGKDKNEVMTTHVLSMLTYLSEQASFNKMMGNKIIDYEKVADNIKSNGLSISGFMIVAPKSELIRIGKADGVIYIYTKPIR